MEKKLDFTENAKNQIEKITKSDQKKYFRISVQGGGCSGFKYNFSFDDKIEKDDILFDKALYATRQLAKRQVTWMKSWDNYINVDIEDIKTLTNKVKNSLSSL